jgi:hypothetical protein
MRKHISAVSSLSLFATVILMLGAFLVPGAVRAQNINQVAKSGRYTFNLKLLPPETFHGAHAEMMHDSGAKAVAVNGSEHPNHHLVVFIKKDGKPVEDAQVNITYRRGQGAWKELPVARMHVAGKGPETTHYGNNVNLARGKYEVRVTVAGAKYATFHFTLGK